MKLSDFLHHVELCKTWADSHELDPDVYICVQLVSGEYLYYRVFDIAPSGVGVLVDGLDVVPEQEVGEMGLF